MLRELAIGSTLPWLIMGDFNDLLSNDTNVEGLSILSGC